MRHFENTVSWETPTSSETSPSPSFAGKLFPSTTSRSLMWADLRHRLSLAFDERSNSHFTGFLRLPTQFEALTRPVVASLRKSCQSGHPLQIAVLGCSNGAEAYTIASVLKDRHPDLSFRIRGYDIAADCIQQAREARYRGEDEVFNNKIITDHFVRTTFDRDGAYYRVKRHLAEFVEFQVGDVLNPDFAARVGRCDAVFAQNFLFHLRPILARRALEKMLPLLRSGSALFIDGTDLGLRHRFVRRHGLKPVDYRIEEIHNEARWARAVGWPYHYWGLEPLGTYRRDWKARYATIFLMP